MSTTTESKKTEKVATNSSKFLNDGKVTAKEVAKLVKATRMSKLYRQKVAQMVKKSGLGLDELIKAIMKSKPVDFKTQRSMIYNYFSVQPKSHNDKNVRDLNGAINDALIRCGKMDREKNKQTFIWK